MNTLTKIQIPIKQQLKESVQMKAEEFGFSSLQELVRFLLTQVDRGVITPSVVNYEQPVISERAIKRLKRYSEELERDIKAGRARVAHSAEELIEQLNEESKDFI